MKNWVNKPHNKMVDTYYQAKFSWGLVKDFASKEKMEEWIKNTKEKYSFDHEPEIKVFKKINSSSKWDTYEEVL